MKHFYKLSEEEKIKQAALDKYLTELTHELDRQGREEKLEKGIKQGREDLILKMLEKGCSVFEVSKMTYLSETEIEKIKNKI